jgi:enoyl-CoA hydratase
MLDIDPRSGVSVLRLRHGKVNALDLELLQALTAAFGVLDEHAAVVITGTGTVFSAGVDLHRVVTGGPPYLREFLPALTAAFLAIFDHPGPVLAAINGHAIAGGCVIAAACDVRAMSQGTIGLAELNVGVPFPVAALEIMRHSAGPAASRLVLAAELLSPAQAQEIGLIHRTEEPAVLLDSVIGQAQRMAQIPAGVYAVSKRQVQQLARDRIAARSGADADVLATWSSADTLAAIAAYLGTLKDRPR